MSDTLLLPHQLVAAVGAQLLGAGQTHSNLPWGSYLVMETKVQSQQTSENRWISDECHQRNTRCGKPLKKRQHLDKASVRSCPSVEQAEGTSSAKARRPAGVGNRKMAVPGAP